TVSVRRSTRRASTSDNAWGPAAASNNDLQRAAGPDRALVHGAQAQMPGEAPVGVEPYTVVSDLQLNRVSISLQADVDAPGAGVLHRVPEGLPADPVQRLLDLDGQLRLGAGDGLGGDALLGTNGVDLPVESCHQALRLKR